MTKQLITIKPEENKGGLQNVQDPNLYRDIYPYSQVCRIPFDGQVEEAAFPGEVWITDTTFRDGMQARTPYTADQIVALYDLLHRLGGESGRADADVVRDAEGRMVRSCLREGPAEARDVRGAGRAR